jgi:hypothetical protein
MVLDLAQHLYNQANERVTTAKLNQAVRQILEERQPSTPSGRRARIYYATQIEVAPPTLVLKVNNPHFFNDAYERFIVNRMRDLLPYAEVPIRLVVRAREHGGVAGTSLEDLPKGVTPREAEAKSKRQLAQGKAKPKTARPRANPHSQSKPRPKKAKPSRSGAGRRTKRR